MTDELEIWTEAMRADNFLRGIQVGMEKWSDIRGYETVYGPSDGFVYFIGVGEPYITHVKIGYTKGNPGARLASLQTGSPFEMQLLGFVFGVQARELELHDVLKMDRVQGEWFVYTEYVEKIISDQLNETAFE